MPVISNSILLPDFEENVFQRKRLNWDAFSVANFITYIRRNTVASTTSVISNLRGHSLEFFQEEGQVQKFYLHMKLGRGDRSKGLVHDDRVVVREKDRGDGGICGLLDIPGKGNVEDIRNLSPVIRKVIVTIRCFDCQIFPHGEFEQSQPVCLQFKMMCLALKLPAIMVRTRKLYLKMLSILSSVRIDSRLL